MDSYRADATAWFEYVADQVGTWKIKFDFLGTYFPTARYYNGYVVTNTSGSLIDSAYYTPSSTAEQTLTVQTNIVYSWPESPLPPDYWTRPVPVGNREWWPIAGHYPWYGPGGGPEWDARYPDTNPYWSARQLFTPWVQAPNTAHIVWKRQGALSGIVGGEMGYEAIIASPGTPSIIYAGRAYQTITKVMPRWLDGTIRNLPTSVWQCYDIRTGEVYWEQTDTTAPTVIEYSYGTPEGVTFAEERAQGVSLVAIGGGRLLKYNPYTGALATNVSLSPLTSGTYYRNGYALSVQSIGGQYRLINWTTLGTTSNFATRIVSNTTYARSSLPSLIDFNAGLGADASGTEKSGSYIGMVVSGFSLATGTQLWNITIDEPQYSGSCNIADHGKVAVLTARGHFLAYDMYSGKLAWKSEVMDYPWDEPGFGAYSIASAYGLFYRNAYSGVYAFDWDTGKIVWKYEAPARYAYDTPYTGRNGVTVYSFNTYGKIADGKYYVYNAEHTPTSPITRGWGLHCINATTGEGIWNITLPGSISYFGTDIGPIADGYMTVGSTDGYMRVYGKGKSATTVTASPKTIADGANVLIEGTVTDQSPAQPGTPCVSKESMTTQMEYLHVQMPIAGLWGNETMTGVPVTLTALDSNGNVENIGTVTTNAYYGTFSYAWTPPIEGTYTIMASFLGDDSYGSSGAATAISVGPAPETPPTPEPQQAPPDYTLPIVGTGIAMILAVAIVGILILRKRA
jgi:hypothetical protein